jgi:hypothetical protein
METVSGRRREKAGTEESVEGTVAREPIAVGSKSEHAALGVREASGTFVVVHIAGDTPFAEETLTALVGQRVTARGRWRNGVLRVERAALEVQSPEGAS